MNKFLEAALLTIWLALGLYGGIGGLCKASFDEAFEQSESDGETVEYEGITYNSVEDLQTSLAQGRIRRYFGWSLDLPSIAALVLAAGAFGAVGGVTRVIAMLAMTRRQLNVRIALVEPLFGALIGIMLLGVAYALPAALTVGATVLRPFALLFLSLLGGAFAERIYLWIGERLGSLSIPEEAPNPRLPPDS